MSRKNKSTRMIPGVCSPHLSSHKSRRDRPTSKPSDEVTAHGVASGPDHSNTQSPYNLPTTEVPSMGQSPAPYYDPATILAQHNIAPQEEIKRRPRFLVWVLGGSMALQFLAPIAGFPDLAPTRIIGGIMADLTSMTTAPLVKNQIDIARVQMLNQIDVARSQALANSIAETEASMADKRGKCGLIGFFTGPEFKRLCNQFSGSYHDPALESAKAQLRQLRQRIEQRNKTLLNSR